MYILISFHSEHVPCTLSRVFVRPALRLFCTRLTVHYLAVYSLLGSRDAAVVRALASGRCGLGSIPGPYVTCRLSLLLVLVSATREVLLSEDICSAFHKC